MPNVTLNAEQKLFVIPAGHGGYSCLGFDVLERRAVAISRWLVSVDSTFSIVAPEAHGTLERYAQYRALLDRAQAYCSANKTRCPCDLTPQLVGLEGKRVEMTTPTGERSRFWVGKSTGWMPCHLEIKTRRSFGGGAVYLPEGSTVRVVANSR